MRTIKSTPAVLSIALLVLCFVFLSSLSASAATYYVSSTTGNDTWPGTQAQPWKTIIKVVQEEEANRIVSGDTILFKRGDVWHLSEDRTLYPFSNTTISAYSSGPNPLFSGSVNAVGPNYVWNRIGTGNKYYLTGPNGTNPNISNEQGDFLKGCMKFRTDGITPSGCGVVVAKFKNQEPFQLLGGYGWRDDTTDIWYPHTPENLDLLENHEWTFGRHNSSMPFDTIYIRSDEGMPGNPDQGGFETVNISQVRDGIVIYWQANVVIDSIDVRYVAEAGIVIEGRSGATNNEIKNCNSSFNRSGIVSRSYDPNDDSKNIVHHCECNSNYMHGIVSVGKGGGFSHIHHNKCWHNREIGVFFAKIRDEGEPTISDDAVIVEYNDTAYNSTDKQRSYGYSGIGIVYDGIDTPIVRYNRTHHNKIPSGRNVDGTGISIRADNIQVYNNLSYFNSGPGIETGHMSEGRHHNIKIFNNICYYNSQFGGGERGEIALYQLTTQGEPKIQIKNNILVRDPSVYPVTSIYYFGYATNLLLDAINNNCYFNSIPLMGGFVADPLFISTDESSPDFLKIKGTSPCVNQGENVNSLLTNFPFKDFQGNTVPYPGTGWDIGAYEVDSIAPTITDVTFRIGTSSSSGVDGATFGSVNDKIEWISEDPYAPAEIVPEYEKTLGVSKKFFAYRKRNTVNFQENELQFATSTAVPGKYGRWAWFQPYQVVPNQEDGDYEVQAISEDSSGSRGIRTFLIHLRDVAPPSIEGPYIGYYIPIDNMIVKNDIYIWWLHEDVGKSGLNLSTITCKYKPYNSPDSAYQNLDSVNILATYGTARFNAKTKLIPNGSYNIKITAADNNNNVSSVVKTVTVSAAADNISPTITGPYAVVSGNPWAPVDNQTFTQPTAIWWGHSDADSGINLNSIKCEYKLSTQSDSSYTTLTLLQKTITEAGVEFPKSTTPDGTYKLRITVDDNSTSSAATVKIVTITAYQHPAYTISGYARDPSNNGINGVTVNFSGGYGSVTTNSSGYYIKSGFPNGTYTVTPSKTDYAFTPASTSVSVSGGNKGQNFSGMSTVDTIVPTVQGPVYLMTYNPVSGKTLNTDTALHMYYADDGSGINLNTVKFEYKLASSSTYANLGLTSREAIRASATFPASSLVNGTYNIRISASDNVGNLGQNVVSVYVNK